MSLGIILREVKEKDAILREKSFWLLLSINAIPEKMTKFHSEKTKVDLKKEHLTRNDRLTIYPNLTKTIRKN